MKTAKQINTPQVGQVTISPHSATGTQADLEPPLTTKELEVLILILTELRAIREQLKTEVVIRDKLR